MLHTSVRSFKNDNFIRFISKRMLFYKMTPVSQQSFYSFLRESVQYFEISNELIDYV